MNPLQHILVFVVRVYRVTLSPAKTFVFGEAGRCRYTPTCSAYALEAVRTHGAFAGSWLALKRVGRCHPWGGCGHDPVPPNGARVYDPQRVRTSEGSAELSVHHPPSCCGSQTRAPGC